MSGKKTKRKKLSGDGEFYAVYSEAGQVPQDFSEAGKLSEDSVDRLGWLLSDPDDDELRPIERIVGYLRLSHCEMKPKQSRDLQDEYNRIAKTAEKLADQLSQCDIASLTDRRYASEIAECFREAAFDADPKGKPQARNIAHSRLAELLCQAVQRGDLQIEMRTHPGSDLAQVFRICCEEIGMKSPTNVSHYFDEAIKAAEDEADRKRRYEEMQGLAQKKIKAILSGGDSERLTREYIEEANRIQKGPR